MNANGDNRHMRDFMWGLGLFLLVQGGAMGGGLLVETLADAPVSGVPSMLGLSAVLLLGILAAKPRSEYVVLGGFSIAFLAPLFLFLVVHFRLFPVHEKLVFFSMGYMTALTSAVWTYFGVRMARGSM